MITQLVNRELIEYLITKIFHSDSNCLKEHSTVQPQFQHTCLELCGGIEFRLNGIQLHPEVLLVHLDSIATFSLDLLFDQHLPRKTEEER